MAIVDRLFPEWLRQYEQAKGLAGSWETLEEFHTAQRELLDGLRRLCGMIEPYRFNYLVDLHAGVLAVQARWLEQEAARLDGMMVWDH